ncbi:MAG: type II secretion system F family protein [Deltaproteobacteria bacterium]|nr:type II secretion system F family protein [Deltaproteobacteria bacterium]
MGVLQLRRRLIAKKKVLARIRTDGAVIDRPHESALPETNRSGLKNSIFNFLINLGNRLRFKKSEHGSIKQIRFLRAGIRNPKAGIIFWGVKCFLTILFLAIFLVLRIFVFTVMNPQLTLALGVFMPFLGFYLPDFWLRQKTEKRQEKLLKALPDALDLMVVCVEAGMGLDEAINRVAKESKIQSRELSDEFAFLGLELRAGKQRQDALKNLAERTDLEEVNNLVTLLIQADKFGTNIANTLRVYSDSFRTERFQRAEEMAAKMPVKLIFPLILFIFPALFIVIIGPAIISIYRNFIMRF